MKFNPIPNYFKKIALGIILLVIAFLIIVKLYNLNLSRTTIKSIAKVSIALAGFFFIIAKEKIEDEFIQSVRLTAYALAFGFFIVLYIIDESHMLDFIGSDNTPDAFKYICNSILMYIIYFYLSKYGIIKRGKQCGKQS
jgi:hypothetical protein